MGVKEDFRTFIEGLEPNNLTEMLTTVGEIAKKLNKEYYNLDNNTTDHMYVVGSTGRGTAIRGSSDLDILFDLPNETYKKFDAYKSNGQSALLQEVKDVMKIRYPKTDISGDGQVVSIEFTKYTVELVPGFKQSDDSFKYPDTHDGGSWKTTKPLAEIAESKKTTTDTKNNFRNMCYMLRAWKNHNGFKFGGLLIDTLSYNFINDKTKYKTVGFSSYLDMVKDIFLYLKGQNKDKSYWYALGSNQQVYNSDNGKFVTMAEKAYNKVKDLTSTSSDLNTVLRDVFGTKFPENIVKKAFSEAYIGRARNTEEFIENLVPVDIRYTLKIDCEVTQNGFREFLLREMLKRHIPLRANKSLKFEIVYTDAPLPYDIYWKVKNEGEEAIRRDCIRGDIMRTNSRIRSESTNFRGPHYVECYIIKNGVCVAKDRIDVPISTY